MKTVVLCIDRDNDVGEKAGVKGPIMGRKENLAAAMKLALADPEDTDLNTIFAAVKIHDKLVAEGRDVEVVTVLGDRNVGITSDEKIAHQLDVIVQVLKADSAVIVTDGAEDEYVLPLIQSRLKLIAINRVIVKSLPTGKETVSILRRYMQEERFRIQLLLPIALVLLTYAVFGVFGVADYFIIALTFVVGGYLAMTALNVADGAHALARTLRVGVATSRLSLAGAVLAAVVLVLGAFVAVRYILTGSAPGGLIPPGQTPTDVPSMVLLFALLFSPVLYGALLIRLSFRLLDFRLRRGRHSGGLKLRYVGYTAYFLIGFGALTVVTAFMALSQSLGFYAGAALVVLGALFSLGGAVASRRMKDRLSLEAEDASA